MAEKQPFRQSWRRHLPIDDPRPSIGVEILVSASNAPPSRKTDAVQHLCRIEVTLPPWSQLPSHRNEQDEEFKEVEFELLMTPTGNSLDWTVLINGRQSGEKKVLYS